VSTRDLPDTASIRAERLRRQALAPPLRQRRAYEKLFRLLQPVSTGAYARPGSPPRLACRTRFDDAREADRLRGVRRIVKGRFQAGGVGYVHVDDLALYANAFQQPLPRPNEVQEAVFQTLCQSGPFTPSLLKEETELLKKQIMPALHRLQRAFLVYEDQVDGNWERGWYEFAAEWPEIELGAGRRDEAAAEVLLRFLRAHVFATAEQLRDWSRFPTRFVERCVRTLEQRGAVVSTRVEGLGKGWLPAEDAALPKCAPAPGVFMLPKQDFLSRSHASELARRFGDRDVLQYLMIDGELRGAVHGHWGFKPYDVEDVAVDLPARERGRRRPEILAAVGAEYRPPRNPIRRYAGKPL